MRIIKNTEDVIDSRDIIERIEELKNFIEFNENPNSDDVIEWGEELRVLEQLAEEASQCSPDWEYGESLIHRDYFEAYMDEMVPECYEMPKGLPHWMSIKLDYDALEMDYMSVDFDGQEYLIR